MSDLFGTDYEGRKAIPIFEGVIMYFPKALAAVAEVSHAGNAQHNPGEPLHWARGKSMDQYNTALRHMMDHRMGGGRIDVAGVGPQLEGQKINNGWKMEARDKDGVRHLAKAAWRVLAALQLDIEEEEREGKATPSDKPELEPEIPIKWDAEHFYHVLEIDRDKTTGPVRCQKPGCKGHRQGTGTCRV